MGGARRRAPAGSELLEKDKLKERAARWIRGHSETTQNLDMDHNLHCLDRPACCSFLIARSSPSTRALPSFLILRRASSSVLMG